MSQSTTPTRPLEGKVVVVDTWGWEKPSTKNALKALAGLRRTTKKSGRKPMPDDRVEAIRRSLIDGLGIRATARRIPSRFATWMPSASTSSGGSLARHFAFASSAYGITDSGCQVCGFHAPDRMNAFGAQYGLEIEHYIISAGLEEMIEGTPIRPALTHVFASHYVYDDKGEAAWPVVGVNYTTKTQYLFRINKGVLNHYEHERINRFIPERALPMLLKIEQVGGIACHTGRHSCFFQKFDGEDWQGTPVGLGARVPIVLTSRADPLSARIASAACRAVRRSGPSPLAVAICSVKSTSCFTVGVKLFE